MIIAVLHLAAASLAKWCFTGAVCLHYAQYRHSTDLLYIQTSVPEIKNICYDKGDESKQVLESLHRCTSVLY